MEFYQTVPVPTGAQEPMLLPSWSGAGAHQQTITGVMLPRGSTPRVGMVRVTQPPSDARWMLEIWGSLLSRPWQKTLTVDG